MTAARASALLAALTALLAVGGCGVPPSGVIQAGDPATGLTSNVNVYFYAGETLLAVPRTPDKVWGVAGALRLLFAGPTPAESSLSTRLPRLPGGLDVETDDVTIRIRLPDGIGPIDKRGMAQLVCTAVRALPARRMPPPRTTPPSALTPAPGGPVPTAAAAVQVHVLVSGAGWKTAQSAASCPTPGG